MITIKCKAYRGWGYSAGLIFVVEEKELKDLCIVEPEDWVYLGTFELPKSFLRQLNDETDDEGNIIGFTAYTVE